MRACRPQGRLAPVIEALLPPAAAGGAPAQRPYLLFVRAGTASTHARMIGEDPARNWDCCVSWYVPPQPERLAEIYCGGGFNKLDGFLEFWGEVPRPAPWRYVMIMDDDVYLRPGDLSRFFALCDRHGTRLAQPALRWLTNTTLNSLVRNPACVLRRVSCVEVMAPCFATATLETLLPTFGLTRSTWGADVAWAGELAAQGVPLYVVDAVAMDHTRSGDGRPTAFYRKLRAMGVDPQEELARVRRQYPAFPGPRTLPGGHVYRPELPAALAPAALWLVERMKFLVRLRKKTLRVVRARPRAVLQALPVAVAAAYCRVYHSR